MRRSPVSSGWNDVPQTLPSRTIDRVPVDRRQDLDVRRPPSRTQGARMNTARTGPPRCPATSRSVSKESTWRPKALRSHHHVEHPELRLGPSLGGRPGEEDHPGTGAQAWAGRRRSMAAQRLDEAEPLGQLADGGGLPTGDDQAAEAVEVGGRAHQHRLGARPPPAAAACSRKSPCRARTPTRTVTSPVVPAGPRRRDRCRSPSPTIGSPSPRDTWARICRVLVVGGRLHDGRGPRRRGRRS